MERYMNSVVNNFFSGSVKVVVSFLLLIILIGKNIYTKISFLNYFIFLQSYATQWKHIAFKPAFSEYQKAR